MRNPAEIFTLQISNAEAEVKRILATINKIAWLRFAVFAAAGAGIWLTWGLGWYFMVGILLVFAILFAFLIQKTVAEKRKKRYQEARILLNQQELGRLKLDFTGIYAGLAYADPNHPYSSDLDIFTQKGLYPLLGRANTKFGRDRLADWVQAPGELEELGRRQQAVTDLSAQVDWRQDFQARGMMFEDSGAAPDGLRKWLQEPFEFLEKPFFRFVPPVLSVIAVGMFFLMCFGIVSYWLFLLAAGINVLVMRMTVKTAERVYESTEGQAKLLNSYAELIRGVENAKFSSPWLREKQALLNTEAAKASDKIARLALIFERLELRLNGLAYVIVNILFFWDVYWILQLDKWKQSNREDVFKWFEAIGDFEALNSLAGLHFAETKWAMPELKSTDFEVGGKAVGHPLLPEGVRVPNDFDITGKGAIRLITGSNMSGKSTFLRTVGINAVLALAGAPVCAESFRVSRIYTCSSMRTQDDLSANMSSFYAELHRLKQVLAWVRERGAVLFLLDEILKGTNSVDRHKGARGLIRQLHQMGASGLVSTHDLELAALENTMNGAVKNLSFNSSLDGKGDLVFDYHLTEGPCRSFNASVLMEKMGIGVTEAN